MTNNDRYDFGGLFFAIAGPVVISGLIGFYTGIIPVHMCVSVVVALYLLLCVANATNRSYNANRYKAKGRRR